MSPDALDSFLRDFAAFLGTYCPSAFDAVAVETVDSDVRLVILGAAGSRLELRSEDQQITCIFGDGHWHLDDWQRGDDPVAITARAVDDTFGVLHGRIGAYGACDADGTSLGASTFEGSTADALRSAHEHFPTAHTLRVHRWGRPPVVEQLAADREE